MIFSNKELLLILKKLLLKVFSKSITYLYLSQSIEKIVSDDPKVTELLARFESIGDENILRDGILDILRPKGNIIILFNTLSLFPLFSCEFLWDFYA